MIWKMTIDIEAETDLSYDEFHERMVDRIWIRERGIKILSTRSTGHEDNTRQKEEGDEQWDQI